AAEIPAAHGSTWARAAGAMRDAVAIAGANVYAGQRNASAIPARATTASETMMRHSAPSTAILPSQVSVTRLVAATPAIATGTREARSGFITVAGQTASVTRRTTTGSHGCSASGTAVATNPLVCGMRRMSP